MQVMSMVVVSSCLMFRLSMGATCQSIERERFIKNIHSEYYSSYTYRFFGVFSECIIIMYMWLFCLYVSNIHLIILILGVCMHM